MQTARRKWMWKGESYAGIKRYAAPRATKAGGNIENEFSKEMISVPMYYE